MTAAQFRIYFSNHFYFSGEQFSTLNAALAYACSKGADVAIYRGEELAASWGIITGLRRWEVK